ncbi:Acetate--CoA ligase [ADP-forming] [uncultured archaeon]|nr:Acetate--CoA ligase [ADP-forming] [uncultured archaeon]
MKRELKNFFYPKTIAVIGASGTEGKVGHTLMEKLKVFDGKVIPVNIHREIIEGKQAYKTVKEYSKEIDLAIIATPAKTVPSLLKKCGKKGVRNVIVISAGFAETGNKRLEKKLIKISKKKRITVLGPNCFGTANPYSKLDCTFSNTHPGKGNIAVISQSGALWSYLSDLKLKNKGFSGFVSLGNMAQLDFSDFIEYFNEDVKTKKIILYIEKVKDGKKFLEACQKSKKEIIAVKAGKTEEGKKATISHTGSLATDYKIYEGIFKQAGVTVKETLAEAIGIKKEKIPIFNKRVLILTNAGGAGALVADILKKQGNKILKPTPLDILGTANAEKYKIVLEGIAKKKEHLDALVAILTPQEMSQPEETAQALIKFKHKTRKQVIACFLGERSINKAKRLLQKNKIVCLTHCC